VSWHDPAARSRLEIDSLGMRAGSHKDEQRRNAFCLSH